MPISVREKLIKLGETKSKSSEEYNEIISQPYRLLSQNLHISSVYLWQRQTSQVLWVREQKPPVIKKQRNPASLQCTHTIYDF